jgi:aconitate hydratase
VARRPAPPIPVFTDTLELDLGTVVPSLAGPKRPQDRIDLSACKEKFALADFRQERWRRETRARHAPEGAELDNRPVGQGEDYEIGHGDVVIAAITSCTNTSNPS